MARKYFGTDGVRGLVGVAPITPDFVMRLGYAAGKVLAKGQPGSGRPTVLIGKDTRISGYMLEAALEAGLSAAGVDVMLAGPMPTPAIAYLTRALRLSAGVVISASHMIRRSASPSSAMPRSAPWATTASDMAWGAVAPTLSLMLKPSGLLPMAITSAPSSWNTCGAML